MRGITGFVTETSLLDAREGIRFRGYSIPELREKLPKTEKAANLCRKVCFTWCLSANCRQTKMWTTWPLCLQRRSHVPNHVFDAIDALPLNTHLMTMYTVGVMALQTESYFSKAYAEGMNKKDYWEPFSTMHSCLLHACQELLPYTAKI